VAETFNDYPHLEHRALQIWQILITKAHARQTINYEELADVMGFGDLDLCTECSVMSRRTAR